MKSNISHKNFILLNISSSAFCNIGSFLYLHLTKDKNFYLRLCAESQGVLILIINIIALVSVKQTKQWQESSLKTTILLLVNHLITTLFENPMLIIFTYLHIKDCRLSIFLLSIYIYLLELNTELICFVSFNRFLHVNLSQTFQRKSKSNMSNVALVMGFLWPFYEFISTNMSTLIEVSFVVDIISLIISMAVVALGVSFNLATFILLHKIEKQTVSVTSCINKRTLQLCQSYIICFTVFKFPIFVSLISWDTKSIALKTKVLLSTTSLIISRLDAVFNSILFFYANPKARCYLMSKLSFRKISSS